MAWFSTLNPDSNRHTDVQRDTLTADTDLEALARDLGIPSFETIHAFLVNCPGTILWRA